MTEFEPGPDEGGTKAAEMMVEVRRSEWIGDRVTEGADLVAREEPLELRIQGVAVAVVMRTPGHDEELCRGFVWTERIVDDPSWVRAVKHCDTFTTPEAEDNVMLVTLVDGVEIDLARLRRNLYASSSCGICGKASIEQVLTGFSPLPRTVRVDREVFPRLPERLRAQQAVFARTGGLHAAALYDAAGEVLVVREDVGRHNAVDKVVGWMVARGLAPAILMVSGRVSYEVVQKTVAARIEVLVAVSAPTSLAIELARAAGLTLVGFVRSDRMVVYAAPERIRTVPEGNEARP